MRASSKQFSYQPTECSVRRFDIGEWRYSDEWKTSESLRPEEAAPESRFSIHGRTGLLSRGIVFRADRLSLMCRRHFCISTSMGFQCTACRGHYSRG